eukprot:CAMPEP_0184860640 /NCGR_PEP_ID=MMETSP0580-20130426/5503_1 /TAXON_ID=1118495 /ORGANISM="Dactyliosolen fragilissimus" /LENGTH=507 /DNA_ID=CAMNT_0027357837 /DNA_START=49 /DNA_END=1572 /DNA_ORIENTATION=-
MAAFIAFFLFLASKEWIIASSFQPSFTNNVLQKDVRNYTNLRSNNRRGQGRDGGLTWRRLSLTKVGRRDDKGDNENYDCTDIDLDADWNEKFHDIKSKENKFQIKSPIKFPLRNPSASILLLAVTILTTTSTMTNIFTPPAHAVTDEGISMITESSMGKIFRKSAIKGAQTIDRLDEKWERLSDSLRDTQSCDENTGRRLYDNGFRKDGVTRIGNPVLGALCVPVPLQAFNGEAGDAVLISWDNVMVKNDKNDSSSTSLSSVTTTTTTTTTMNNDQWKEAVQKIDTLVRPSFERSIKELKPEQEQERQRKLYNMEIYKRTRAFQDFISSQKINNNSRSQSPLAKSFDITWGQSLISYLAPNANRNDFSSPFPQSSSSSVSLDDFEEDYDYDKNQLLDALGTLQAALKTMQRDGLVGYFEISIPKDDYGSVVTLAIDDDITIQSQLLAREQSLILSGSSVQALLRAVLAKANLFYTLDSFFIDPSTTNQNEYNPTQVLFNVSNLRAKE